MNKPETDITGRFTDRPKSMLLADVVYDSIRRAIANGDYAEDERLPGENALADQFDVSRPVIRAALKRLREEGLVTSRQGSGSYVSNVRRAQAAGVPAVGNHCRSAALL